jgi:quinol monooxygenase YgiN
MSFSSPTNRLRNFGVFSDISNNGCARWRQLSRPLDFLSCCFSGLFQMEANRITCWRVSCDEARAMRVVRPDGSRKNLTLIVFSMQIVAPDEKRTEILRTLGSLLGPTRAAAGCMQAQLYADLDKRKTLFLLEEWESREQFERNLDAVKLNTIVAMIELSSHAPVVHVDSVVREEGVNTLALHPSAQGVGRH